MDDSTERRNTPHFEALMDAIYAQTVRLLLVAAPDIFANDIFAMKGGTAINLLLPSPVSDQRGMRNQRRQLPAPRRQDPHPPPRPHHTRRPYRDRRLTCRSDPVFGWRALQLSAGVHNGRRDAAGGP